MEYAVNVIRTMKNADLLAFKVDIVRRFDADTNSLEKSHCLNRINGRSFKFARAYARSLYLAAT